MKALAEFAMRGRFQALLVTVATSGSLLFCWIGAAVIALVTLRRGAGEGSWLLFWALLPAGTVLYVLGDSSPLTLILAAWFLALVLRASVSLSLTVLASLLVGLVTGLALLSLGADFLAQMAVGQAGLLFACEIEPCDNGLFDL